MIIIEEKKLNNIRKNIIKYLKENFNKNENLINVVELALYIYENEIIKYNNYNNNNSKNNK